MNHRRSILLFAFFVLLCIVLTSLLTGGSWHGSALTLGPHTLRLNFGLAGLAFSYLHTLPSTVGSLPIHQWNWYLHGFGLYYSSNAAYTAYAFRPPWWPLLILIIATRVLYIRHRSHRLRLGLCLCLHCGYDLRASKERCPECGEPIPAAACSRAIP